MESNSATSRPSIENDSQSQEGVETLTGGALFADYEARTVSGVLMPWGQLSARGVAGGDPAKFERGGLKAPRDISIVSANIEHDRYTPVARATSLEDTDAGLVATFSVAETEEGDSLLSEVAAGRLSKLSAEVKNIVRTGADTITAVLTGAAFVTKGAFDGAELFSLEFSDETNPSDAVLAAIKELLTPQTSEAPATEPQETEPENPDLDKEDAMADAVAPESATPDSITEEAFSKNDVFDAIVAARKNGDSTAVAKIKAAEVDMFALSDVKTTGSGQLGTSTIQTGWLGELWNGDNRSREIVPLFQHADLTSFDVKGFYFSSKPTIATWTGNKAAITSPTYTVATRTASIQRFAAGYDIAREFMDIAAGREVIESFLNKLVDSYVEVSDDYVLNTIVSSLTGVEAATYPAGVGDGWGKIIQGMQKLRTNRARADFAVVATDVADAMDYTSEADKLALFSQTRGGLSSLNYIVSDELEDGQVLVGDSRAATVFELPGAPIRVNALDIANGGVDEAIFAYVSVLVENPAALALIETPAGP